MNADLKIKPYKAKDGWRWRARTKNGKIIAESGEAYSSKAGAFDAANRLVALIQFKVTVVVADPQ